MTSVKAAPPLTPRLACHQTGRMGLDSCPLSSCCGQTSTELLVYWNLSVPYSNKEVLGYRPSGFLTFGSESWSCHQVAMGSCSGSFLLRLQFPHVYHGGGVDFKIQQPSEALSSVRDALSGNQTPKAYPRHPPWAFFLNPPATSPLVPCWQLSVSESWLAQNWVPQWAQTQTLGPEGHRIAKRQVRSRCRGRWRRLRGGGVLSWS